MHGPMQSIGRVLFCSIVAALVGSSSFCAIAADSPSTPSAMNPTTAPAETPEQHNARMAWWREARFGMFIHWGVYSVPAGFYNGKAIPDIGEWIMNNASIPLAAYAKYAGQFTAEKFNADEWVSLAKNAGMKYIVITAKHHDGFAMFHTQVDGYNIFDATPFKRDPLAELAKACQKQNIKLGFYYSQVQDWHHPGGDAFIKNGRKTPHWDSAQDGSFDDYLKTVALPQMCEILTNYGPVAVLWFDTPTPSMTRKRAQPFVDLMHELQPQIVWNNRLGGGFRGDTETPEQFIPPGGFPGRDWETCMTINDTWGYKSDDQNFKPVENLLHNLIDIASKGGNYLLNVGPTSQGVIPQPEVERLQAVGGWLKTNGDSIYGSSATPFKRQPRFGRITQKPADPATGQPAKLFLHVFNWPEDGALWLPLKSKINKAYLLASPDRTFPVEISKGGTAIQLSGDAPDTIASVVVAELDGPPQTFVPPLDADADGAFTLQPADASLTGSAKVSSRRRQNVLTLGTGDDVAGWEVNVTQPGMYSVQLTYSCDPKHAGGRYEIAAGDQKLGGKVEPTKNADDFTTITVGALSLGKLGPLTIAIRASEITSPPLMNLKALKLNPQ